MNTPQEYLSVLVSQKRRILRVIGICCVLSLSSYFVLPKTYKVSTTVALQTQYFQLPMISGFMTEVHDNQELRAKREALIRLALNQKFVEGIAQKYKLLKDPGDSYELKQLSKRFEVFPNGPSAYVVSFTAKDPEVAYSVIQDFVNHLRTVMRTERHDLLLTLHDAIEEQLEAISVNGGDSTNPIYSIRPDLVRRKLDKIQSEIEMLKTSYSEQHPRVSALKDQASRLSLLAQETPEMPSTDARHADAFNGLRVDSAVKELYDDFLKKYRYLQVVLYMDQQNKDSYLSFLEEPFFPKSPVFPKLPILLVWGVAAGFFIGAFLVLRRSAPLLEAETYLDPVPRGSSNVIGPTLVGNRLGEKV